MEIKTPYSQEAEESVLGSIFFSESEIKTIADKLQVEDFYNPSHQEIYQAILKLFNNGNSIDVITVSNFLENINYFMFLKFL